MSNKYSIVTGASRGLGAAIAEELAREGYDVVITYCTQADKAQKVKKQLETKFGVRVESYQLDIKDEEAVLAFRKWVEETLGTGRFVPRVSSTHLRNARTASSSLISS